jgi:hypothetical protein
MHNALINVYKLTSHSVDPGGWGGSEEHGDDAG